MKTYLTVAAISYLLGSIPFGYILVKIFLKKDIRTTGSGNIGATNVARSGAMGLAVATLLLDALKGVLAVMAAVTVNGNTVKNGYPYEIAALAALCAIAGHMFPIWLKFRGGKGVATAVGAFLVLAPKALAVIFVIFLLAIAATRFVSLGSILSAALFPVLAYSIYRGRFPVSALGMLAAVSLLIIVKHHENIHRLITGTENRLGAKKHE